MHMKKFCLMLLSALFLLTVASCGNKVAHTHDNACDTTCHEVEAATDADTAEPINANRDNPDGQSTVSASPKGENDGIDLPIVRN